jgi:23S rRNA pseudouridine2605 synthase
MEERVQKLLARAGYGSRRKCEELISSGRVTINGQTPVLGDKADSEKDLILVDGIKLSSPEHLIYIILNKPRGVLSTTSDPEKRTTVRDLVPITERLYPVGRLDADSEGLLILTNDGNLTNLITHPRYEHEKEYHVLVAGSPDEDQISSWKNGIVLNDGFRTKPARIRFLSRVDRGTWLSIVLKEGHKRQIREMGVASGMPVKRIIRVRIGNLQIGSLKPKEWRHLTSGEVAELFGKPHSTQRISSKSPDRHRGRKINTHR